MARSKLQQIPLLDPDAIARSLQELAPGPASDIEAGKQVLRQAEQLLEERQSFTVETTLSGATYLRMVTRAKRSGFSVMAFLIGTESVEVNLQRVRARVKKGGHDVPEVDQRRRYPRTLANMERLLPLVDLAILFDNSTDQGHRLLAVGHPDHLYWFEPVPTWAQRLKAEASRL